MMGIDGWIIGGGGGGAKGMLAPPLKLLGGLPPPPPRPPLPTPMEYSIVWDSTSLHNRDAPQKFQNGSARVLTGFIRPTSLFYIRMRLSVIK